MRSKLLDRIEAAAAKRAKRAQAIADAEPVIEASEETLSRWSLASAAMVLHDKLLHDPVRASLSITSDLYTLAFKRWFEVWLRDLVKLLRYVEQMAPGSIPSAWAEFQVASDRQVLMDDRFREGDKALSHAHEVLTPLYLDLRRQVPRKRAA